MACLGNDQHVALCQCGCGLPAPIADRTRSAQGWKKGRPKRFVQGHNNKTAEGKAHLSAVLRGNPRLSHRGASNPSWKGDDVGMIALHAWLQRWWPKAGICDECGSTRPTEYANISGKYRRSRDDFRELCIPCHRTYDQNPVMVYGGKLRWWGVSSPA